MCGIFGGYNAPINKKNMQRAAEALHHRGPDGSSYHSEGEHFLASVRLAITGEPGMNQPFISNDGRVKIVANGEVYNWQEIRRELGAKNYLFKTNCDLEILPSAWQEWGVSMFAKLNGMFSIAILEDKQLTLARDACGQKPLYITQRGEALYFASEIRVFPELGFPLEFSKDFVGQYLGLRYVPEPNTLIRDVHILPAGHYLQIGTLGVPNIQRWWTPPKVSENRSILPYHESVTQLGQHVDESVRLACPRDQPVTLYLSSGIDSALLLESMQKTGAQIRALTASFGQNSDEGLGAQSLAESYGVEHHHVGVGHENLSRLEKVVAQMEVPVGDSLILAFDALASRASGLGSRVAMGGEGPDELFQGYSFQKLFYYAEKSPPLLRHAVGLGVKYSPDFLLEVFSNFPTALGKQGKAKITQWLLDYQHLSNWEKGAGLRMLFTPSEIDELLIDNQWKDPEMASHEDIIEAHHQRQFNDWLPDWSIIRQDRNTMAHSLEYRMPFLDVNLMRYSGQLPMNYKIRAGKTKWLWRELAKQRLGSRIGSIAKKPFYMPVESLTNSRDFQELVGDLLSYDRVKRRGLFCPKAVESLVKNVDSKEFLSVKKVMALVILELWCIQSKF